MHADELGDDFRLLRLEAASDPHPLAGRLDLDRAQSREVVVCIVDGDRAYVGGHHHAPPHETEHGHFAHERACDEEQPFSAEQLPEHEPHDGKAADRPGNDPDQQEQARKAKPALPYLQQREALARRPAAKPDDQEQHERHRSLGRNVDAETVGRVADR
jgi:hypothetical protein